MADGDFDYLATIKTMLNIVDDSKDNQLNICIDMVRQSILNYCNIFKFPSELNYVLCSIVVDIFLDIDTINGNSRIIGGISSITEDGREVDFGSSSNDIQYLINDKITKKQELNRFKKLYRISIESS